MVRISLLTDAAVVSEEQVSSLVRLLQRLSMADVIRIVVTAVVLIVIVKLLTRFFDRMLYRSRMDPSMYGFVRAFIRIFLWFVVITILASSIGINITSLVALLSVAGLAITLALQNSLSNVASGLVILSTKPFKVGDFVQIGEHEGFVRDISLTYTRIVAYDARNIFIPNSNITSASVVNYTRDGKRRICIDVSASYDSPVDLVKDAAMDAIQKTPGILDDPAPGTMVQEYGESAIVYRLLAWCENETYWDCYYGLMEEIKRSFDESGVIMTYPHLNIHMRQ